MTWSPQQEEALKKVKAWYDDVKDWKPSELEGLPNQVFYLAGYAGTGKTTLAKEMADGIKNVQFGAFTGKAADVLTKKGCPASTIHSLIYRLDEFSEGELTFVLNEDSPVKWSKLVVIDEVSMVNDELGVDLESFGKPILVLGDPAQLPPVQGAGYFTERTPNYMLTEIHRQAADNPIIQLATQIRQGKMPKHGDYGESRIVKVLGDETRAMNADQMIVGRNKTRQTFNDRARELRGFTGDIPNDGEKLICLQNNKNNGLFNGSIWTVLEVIEPEATRPTYKIESEDGRRKLIVDMHRHYFVGEKPEWFESREADHFDYGYAITAHKSQGSQWNHVVVFDESWVFRADRWKWLYTAVTRAAEKVDIISRG